MPALALADKPNMIHDLFTALIFVAMILAPAVVGFRSGRSLPD